MDDNPINSDFISLKGKFLIAMPEMQDPNFSRTVTCICEHTPQGALGLTINRPHPLIVTEQIFHEFKMAVHEKIGKEPIYIGGPVQLDEIYILHGPPFNWKGTLKITDTVAMSNTVDLLEALASGTGPHRSLMMLGCSGWGPGQLERELRENVWLTTDANDLIIFKTKPEDCWDMAIRGMGIDPLLLASEAGNA